MEFKENQAIYLQIADFICEHIITHKWPIGEKIASVRSMAAEIEVNPNTVMRTYTHLQETGILNKERGIGFFVSPSAPDKILDLKRKTFVEEQLPNLFKQMELLKIDIKDLEQLHQSYQKNKLNGNHENI